jgi:hypothetical protein
MRKQNSALNEERAAVEKGLTYFRRQGQLTMVMYVIQHVFRNSLYYHLLVCF